MELLIFLVFPQVIMPGYCVQGTVGHKILSGQRKLEMEGRQIVSLIFNLGQVLVLGMGIG